MNEVPSLQRRHHESYSESLALKIGRFEQSCRELSKVLKQLDSFEHVGYLLTERPHPRPKDNAGVRTTLPASWAETARRPSRLIARASLGGGGFL